LPLNLENFNSLDADLDSTYIPRSPYLLLHPGLASVHRDLAYALFHISKHALDVFELPMVGRPRNHTAVAAALRTFVIAETYCGSLHSFTVDPRCPGGIPLYANESTGYGHFSADYADDAHTIVFASKEWVYAIDARKPDRLVGSSQACANGYIECVHVGDGHFVSMTTDIDMTTGFFAWETPQRLNDAHYMRKEKRVKGSARYLCSLGCTNEPCGQPSDHLAFMCWMGARTLKMPQFLL